VLGLNDDGTISRRAGGAIAQLARHMIAVWPMRLRLRIAGSVEMDVSHLRTELSSNGAPMGRMEIVIDAELSRGRAVLESSSHTGG
jgi:hypothetical protein